MSSFPELEKLAIRFAVLLPAETEGYYVYHTNSFESARSLLSRIETSILGVDHEIVDERPFVAVMTTNETLPDVNLLFVPIKDHATNTPRIIPVIGESSLHETSKDDIRHSMVILPVKHKVSVFKSSSAVGFIETVGSYIERILRSY